MIIYFFGLNMLSFYTICMFIYPRGRALEQWASQSNELTLDRALDFVTLPKVLCNHPTAGVPISLQVSAQALCVSVSGFPQKSKLPDGVWVADVTVRPIRRGRRGGVEVLTVTHTSRNCIRLFDLFSPCRRVRSLHT